jgi:hypothetical protein
LEFGESLKQSQKSSLVAFLFLWLFTSGGIFLHELGHHIFGIPSELSLSRNWPLVPVTKENKGIETVGTLAGPTINLFLGYVGFLIFFAIRHRQRLRNIGYFLGLANTFLLVVATAVNFGVDLSLERLTIWRKFRNSWE